MTLPPPPPGAGPPRTPPAGADPIAAPPAPVDPGRSAYLVLDLRHHRLNHLMRTVTPVISVNGCPVPGRWGRNEVPVPSGRSHVHIHLPSAFPSRVGPADAAVWPRPGEVVELEYRAPLWAFSRGALGPAPQRWPGRGALLAVVTPMILALLVFASFLARFLS